MAATAISGTAFGAALAYSGVWRPDVVYQQFYLQDFSMMHVFLSASVASAVAVLVVDLGQIAKVKARPTSTIGLFPYDANVLGGCLIGLGMALSNACPGVVLIQAARGIPSGYYGLAGCLLGATVYAAVADIYQRRSGKPIVQTTAGQTIAPSPSSQPIVLLGYAAACAAAAVALQKTGYSKLLQQVAVSGGMAIGAAQLLSLLLRKSTVGISSGYSAIGDYVWSRLSRKAGTFAVNWQPLIFNAGVIAGSLFFLQSGSGKPLGQTVAPLRALAGGASMAIGARIAGGCTSGHGISGMATLGISSFISVAAMFGAGIASANLLL